MIPCNFICCYNDVLPTLSSFYRTNQVSTNWEMTHQLWSGAYHSTIWTLSSFYYWFSLPTKKFKKKNYRLSSSSSFWFYISFSLLLVVGGAGITFDLGFKLPSYRHTVCINMMQYNLSFISALLMKHIWVYIALFNDNNWHDWDNFVGWWHTEAWKRLKMFRQIVL